MCARMAASDCSGSRSWMAGKVDFVDQTGLDNLQNLIKAYRPYDNALARNDVHHALDHQAIQRLMDGCPANFQHRRELQFINVLAGLEGAGDDAMLDGIVR